MTTCGIYARKSSDDSARDKSTRNANDLRSTTRQIERATEYATARGWTVDERFIFRDEATSGAEWPRPGFSALLQALGSNGRPPFEILLVSELSRIGRGSPRTLHAILQLEDSGVAIHSYLKGAQVTLEDERGEIETTVESLVASLERRRAKQRTHDALLRRAQTGLVANGVCFGYRNDAVLGDDGKRKHSVRVIAPDEAAVVVRIFEAAAAGQGYRAIAYALNAEHAPAPSPRRPGRAPSWSMTTVRDVLNRETYRGLVTWNQRRREIRHGKRAVARRPESEWVRREAPELRIVTDAQWSVAHERLAATRATYLAATNGVAFAGRPIPGTESRHLLTGMLTCATCTGTMFAHQDHGYLCTRFHTRGRSVCPNGWEASMKLADGAVLDSVEHDLLNVPVLETALAKALQAAQPADDDGRLLGLRKELAKLDREVTRLAAAIASGGSLESLLGALQARERDRAHVRAAVAEVEHQRGAERAPRDILTALRAAVADLKGTLRGAVGPARQVLRSLLAGRLVFTPTTREGERFYSFEGPGTVSPIISGVLPMACASRP